MYGFYRFAVPEAANLKLPRCHLATPHLAVPAEGYRPRPMSCLEAPPHSPAALSLAVFAPLRDKCTQCRVTALSLAPHTYHTTHCSSHALPLLLRKVGQKATRHGAWAARLTQALRIPSILGGQPASMQLAGSTATCSHVQPCTAITGMHSLGYEGVLITRGVQTPLMYCQATAKHPRHCG